MNSLKKFIRTWFTSMLVFETMVTFSAFGEVDSKHKLYQRERLQQSVPSLIVFGDSTVDAGNNNFLQTVVKSNFPPYGRDYSAHTPTGRFCNGFLVADYVAERLGLPFPLPYLHPKAKGKKIVTGVNFASSGSGLLDQTAQNFNVASIKQQVKWYHNYLKDLAAIVGNAMAGKIISEALFIVSTGSNDFVNDYYLNPVLQAQYDTQGFQSTLLYKFQEFVQELYKSGARNIATVSLPPLGCLPSQITLHGGDRSVCVDSINKDSASFSEKFKKTINLLSEDLKGIKLVYFDVYNILLEASNNPQKYGFMHARRACCGLGLLVTAILCNELTPGTCSNASSYIFWDSFHPSSDFNRLIANAFFKQTLPQIIPGLKPIT